MLPNPPIDRADDLFLWVRVTGSPTGSAYPWQQVLDADTSFPDYEAAGFGQSGTAVDLPLREVNGRTDVPTGTKVLARLSPGNEFLTFEYAGDVWTADPYTYGLAGSSPFTPVPSFSYPITVADGGVATVYAYLDDAQVDDSFFRLGIPVDSEDLQIDAGIQVYAYTDLAAVPPPPPPLPPLGPPPDGWLNVTVDLVSDAYLPAGSDAVVSGTAIAGQLVTVGGTQLPLGPVDPNTGGTPSNQVWRGSVTGSRLLASPGGVVLGWRLRVWFNSGAGGEWTGYVNVVGLGSGGSYIQARTVRSRVPPPPP